MENKDQKGIFTRIYDWFNGLTVKGLLGAILVAFVIIIVLMTVSSLPGIMGRISNSFSAALYSVFVPAESASVTTDKRIVGSGEDFTINFKKGDTATNGLFTISYGCDSNADLVSVEASGLKKITCDTPYYLLENATSIKIRATTADSVVRLVLTGGLENNDTQKSETVGLVRVTVTNNSAGVIVNAATTSTSSTPAVSNTSNTYTPPPVYTAPAVVQPAYYGKADLAVRILQVGLLSGTTIINTQSQFNSTDMVGVKFEVKNDGDANSGLWSFTATLPSISNPTYNSDTELSLKPGDSIIFTLGFSNLMNQYSDLITINADPLGLVSEINKSNNIVTSTITNLGYNSSNYYNYNNSTGCYINGVYTYNCNNNYNGNCYYNGVYNSNYCYNNNSNNNNLTISCYPSNVTAQLGQSVSWNPVISGGSNSYSYYWTGTDGLSSSLQHPAITYYTSGNKTANLTVTSGGYTTMTTCSLNVNGNSYYNYNYGNLDVTCYATPNNTGVGSPVYWTAIAVGGSGNYVYSWSGDENLYGSGPNLTKYYSYSGSKNATVTIWSNGNSVSRSCSAYVY